jgi:hypothetical protein
MENSTLVTTSVTPPKPALTSIASTGLRNEEYSVLHNPYEIGQTSESSSQRLQDHQHNPLNQYQESLRSFRIQSGLLSEPLLELNEHGYNLPLEQSSSNHFFYGSCDSSHGVSPAQFLPSPSASNHQFIPVIPGCTLEMDQDFTLNKNRHELSEKFGLKDFKVVPDAFQRGRERSFFGPRFEKSTNLMKDTVSLSSMGDNDVCLQLPGIETFSSPISSPFLASSKVTSQESIPPNLRNIQCEKSTIILENTLLNSSPIDSKIPYPLVKEDIPYLISNNLEAHDPDLLKSETPNDSIPSASSIITGVNPSMIYDIQSSSLPQYPCSPSPSKCNTFPLNQPSLPINYRPLLENLRPIRRTEEIVRLKNDGGKITIVETTDDPGKPSKYFFHFFVCVHFPNCGFQIIIL